MKTFGLILIAGSLSACGVLFPQTEYKDYCLQEHESNGYDYMVVAEDEVCDQASNDVEWFEAPVGMDIGAIAYVEKDGAHSTRNRKSSSTINPVTSYPAFNSGVRTPQPLVPTQPKICPKANYKPAPPPPAPKPPAPVAPKPQPAPITPKPVPAPATPAPTIKPGC